MGGNINNFKELTDYEKLGYSNYYAIALKKKNSLLESRLVIMIKLLYQQKKLISKMAKELKKLKSNG